MFSSLPPIEHQSDVKGAKSAFDHPTSALEDLWQKYHAYDHLAFSVLCLDLPQAEKIHTVLAVQFAVLAILPTCHTTLEANKMCCQEYSQTIGCICHPWIASCKFDRCIAILAVKLACNCQHMSNSLKVRDGHPWMTLKSLARMSNPEDGDHLRSRKRGRT
jgi:hypothetical protein